MVEHSLPDVLSEELLRYLVFRHLDVLLEAIEELCLRLHPQGIEFLQKTRHVFVVLKGMEVVE